MSVNGSGNTGWRCLQSQKKTGWKPDYNLNDLGFKAGTTLGEGLRSTYAEYLK
jgi:hypothetical protein